MAIAAEASMYRSRDAGIPGMAPGPADKSVLPRRSYASGRTYIPDTKDDFTDLSSFASYHTAVGLQPKNGSEDGGAVIDRK